MSTRLRFAVVGLGQCGGNLANTFARYGYPAVAVNTSILDLKDLQNIPDAQKIHIPPTESDGAGKDPRIGEQAIQQHLATIMQALQPLVRNCDAILLAAGLGGGTGSNVALLGKLLRRFEIPIVALTTIPTDNESALAKINALRAVNQIVAEDLDSCVLIDNSKILQVFPESSLAAFYPQANEYVVKSFVNFNSMFQEFASRSLISFDNEDFRKVLLSKGILIFGETELRAEEIRTLDELLPQLKTIWETSGLMAEGFNYTSAASGAVCIFAPPEVLQRTSSRFLNMLGEEFKTLTNGATCYFGIYEHNNPAVVKVATMLGRLTIPVRLQELLAEASTEGRNLNRKIQQELPTLDISVLDGMELFASAPPRGTDTAVLAQNNAAEGGPLDQKPAYAPEEYVRLKRNRGRG